MATKNEKNKFSAIIISKAENEGTNYIDSIINYCEETGLEIEVAATLLNIKLKDLIRREAEKLHYIKEEKDTTLF